MDRILLVFSPVRAARITGRRWRSIRPLGWSTFRHRLPRMASHTRFIQRVSCTHSAGRIWELGVAAVVAAERAVPALPAPAELQNRRRRVALQPLARAEAPPAVELPAELVRVLLRRLLLQVRLLSDQRVKPQRQRRRPQAASVVEEAADGLWPGIRRLKKNVGVSQEAAPSVGARYRPRGISFFKSFLTDVWSPTAPIRVTSSSIFKPDSAAAWDRR